MCAREKRRVRNIYGKEEEKDRSREWREERERERDGVILLIQPAYVLIIRTRYDTRLHARRAKDATQQRVIIRVVIIKTNGCDLNRA